MRFGIRDMLGLTALLCAYFACYRQLDLSISNVAIDRFLALMLLMAVILFVIVLSIRAWYEVAWGPLLLKIGPLSTWKRHFVVTVLGSALCSWLPWMDLGPLGVIVLGCCILAHGELTCHGTFLYEEGVAAFGHRRGSQKWKDHRFRLEHNSYHWVLATDMPWFYRDQGRHLIPDGYVDQVRAILAAKQEEIGTTDHTDAHG